MWKAKLVAVDDDGHAAISYFTETKELTETYDLDNYSSKVDFINSVKAKLAALNARQTKTEAIKTALASNIGQEIT